MTWVLTDKTELFWVLWFWGIAGSKADFLPFVCPVKNIWCGKQEYVKWCTASTLQLCFCTSQQLWFLAWMNHYLVCTIIWDQNVQHFENSMPWYSIFFYCHMNLLCTDVPELFWIINTYSTFSAHIPAVLCWLSSENVTFSLTKLPFRLNQTWDSLFFNLLNSLVIFVS